MMAAAAIALATPAFAQTGTVAATTQTTPAVSAPATPTAQPAAKTTADVKTPDVKAADKTTVEAKKNAMAKPESKDTMKKSENTDKSSIKGKVSALHHHKTDKSAKTEKTVG
jgi:hypothetical protein